MGLKAVIMAGGEGSRLRPLTINRPKPMVSLVDRHAMHHIIELLKKHGITDVIITVQYLANVVQNYYGDGSNYGVNITYSVEDMPLGTAGSVKNAEHLLQEPFLVISGDALTDFNLSHIISEHIKSNATVTITLTRVPNPLDYGVVIIDEESHVQQFLEKPSWGEVFSDTVNTGIYVLDPSVFHYIEKGKSVDWSKDVFPSMLDDGLCVMGYVAEGYWTDVGTIEEYMRACADYLMGRVHLPRLGKHIGGGIWVDQDADIAPSARLHGPIYLGHGVKIRNGATINGPSFILDYTIIDEYANVDRSIVWSNSYIGERSELRGTIVLRHCDVRNRVVLFENVVVGDNVQIGSGAVIQPNLKIWPGKEIDEGATVTSSIIWGSHARRVLFGHQGISGLVNIEITPEFCAIIGSAYGATLPRGATVTINRAPHFTPRMLKRAIVAGIPSAGVDVCDLQSVPIPVARYYTQACGAAGGIHVQLSPSDSRMVEIKFFDESGLDISTNTERKIESNFFRGDYRRAYLDEIGRISYPTAIGETYIKAFLQALEQDALERMVRSEQPVHHPYMVIDYANADASGILSTILSRLNMDVVELNANLDQHRVVQTVAQIQSGIHRLTQITPVLDAQLGVRIKSGGEQIVLVDNKGNCLSGIRALAAMTLLQFQTYKGGTVAIPVTAPRAFEEIADMYGGRIIRTKATIKALMQTATKYPFAPERRYDDLLLLGDGNGSYIFPAFYPIVDGLFAILKLMELLTRNNTTLADIVDRIPPYHLNQTKVPCRWESKGKVMRILNEQYHDRKLEQVDGVKIDLGEEWVLILPDADRPFFDVIAEGSSDERARVLTEKYAGLVAGLQ